jgi:hypothetical protein
MNDWAKRAADRDRAAVADQLRAALDEGRLSLHEYDERLQRAYAAKTYADLGDLVLDLPAPPPVVAPPAQAAGPAGSMEPPRRTNFPASRRPAVTWMTFLLVIVVAAAILGALAWSFLT